MIKLGNIWVKHGDMYTESGGLTDLKALPHGDSSFHKKDNCRYPNRLQKLLVA